MEEPARPSNQANLNQLFELQQINLGITKC